MIDLWHARANAGDPEAQFQLGYCYETGRGIPQDFNAAAEWYLRGARQGHAQAQFRLGLAYSNGIGIAWNLGEACQWLMLASAGQIAEAQKLLNTIQAPPEIRKMASEKARSFSPAREVRVFISPPIEESSRPTKQVERQPGLDLWR